MFFFFFFQFEKLHSLILEVNFVLYTFSTINALEPTEKSVIKDCKIWITCERFQLKINFQRNVLEA
jgi:hypothetical protein